MNTYFSLSSTSTNDLFGNSGTNSTNSTSTNGNPQTSSNDLNNPTPFSYETDYSRGGFSSNFDRASFASPTSNKDPLMNGYSNFSMMQAAAAASMSNSTSHHHHHHLHQQHHQQQQQQQQQQGSLLPLQPQQVQQNQAPLHLQQHSSTNDYLLTTSNGVSPWKQAEPIASSSLASTNGNDMMSSGSMQAPPHSHHQLSSFSMAVTNPMLYYAHPWMRPGKTTDSLHHRLHMQMVRKLINETS